MDAQEVIRGTECMTWLRSDVVHTIVELKGKQVIEVLPPLCTDHLRCCSQFL